MNTTWPLRFFGLVAENGNSSRQGPHQLAHLFTTTGLPRSLSIFFSNASLPPAKKLADGGASSGVAASGEGRRQQQEYGGQPTHAPKDGRAPR